MKIPPRYVFDPFSADEVWALKRFVRKVDELNESELAEAQVGFRLQQIPGAQVIGGQAWQIEAEGASKKEVKAAATDFRQLYNDHEPTSAMRVLNILKGSARSRGTDGSREAIDALRDLGKKLQERKKTDPRGKTLEEQPFGESVERSPDDMIQTWFNGEIFHAEQALDEEIGPEGHATSEMLMFGLQTAIQDYIRYWNAIRDLVVEVLKDEALQRAA